MKPKKQKSKKRQEPGFYIIWNPTSDRPPKAMFQERKLAIAEAQRLATEYPGSLFYVCVATAVSEVVQPPVETRSLGAPNEAGCCKGKFPTELPEDFGFYGNEET